MLFSNVIDSKCNISATTLVQYNDYLVNNVDTDSLVLEQQGISSHSAENASMHFQLFMG